MVGGRHVGAGAFAVAAVVAVAVVFGSFLGAVGGGVVVVDGRSAVVCFLQLLTGKIASATQIVELRRAAERGAGRKRGRKREEGW